MVGGGDSVRFSFGQEVTNTGQLSKLGNHPDHADFSAL